MSLHFDLSCTACPRLADFLASIREEYPDYHALPVEPFGDDQHRVLVVGLAPGMHCANKTGRPFTGDYAGVLLYETLHKYGFASAPESISRDDGLALIDCCITNAVKCFPPQNKPNGDEIKCCNPFLATELQALPDNAVVIALGSIAHNAVLKAIGAKQSAYRFGHGHEHQMEHFLLIDSYHCSRYNTQTKRLTPEMFHAVFARARDIIS